MDRVLSVITTLKETDRYHGAGRAKHNHLKRSGGAANQHWECSSFSMAASCHTTHYCSQCVTAAHCPVSATDTAIKAHQALNSKQHKSPRVARR